MGWFEDQGVPTYSTRDPNVNQTMGASGGRSPTEADLVAILQKYPTNNDGFRAAVAEINQTFGPNTVSILEHPTRLDKFTFNGNVYDAMIAATGTSGQWVNRLSPEGPAPGGTGGGTAPGGQSYQQIFESLIGGRPPTLETLKAMEPELRKYGMSLEWNARGTGADIRLPNGQIIDVIQGLEGGGQNWQWLGPGGGGMDPGGAVYPAGGGGVMGFMGQDPSYQFRIQEAQKGLERGAAARGTLLTGGFQKALGRYLQDYASTEFGNIFNRNYQLAGLGLNAAGSMGNTNSSYANNMGNLYGNQGNIDSSGTVGRSNNTRDTIGTLGDIWSQYPWGGRPKPEWEYS